MALLASAMLSSEHLGVIASALSRSRTPGDALANPERDWFDLSPVRPAFPM
jgi:hypothetical protein